MEQVPDLESKEQMLTPEEHIRLAITLLEVRYSSALRNITSDSQVNSFPGYYDRNRTNFMRGGMAIAALEQLRRALVYLEKDS